MYHTLSNIGDFVFYPYFVTERRLCQLPRFTSPEKSLVTSLWLEKYATLSLLESCVHYITTVLMSECTKPPLYWIYGASPLIFRPVGTHVSYWSPLLSRKFPATYFQLANLGAKVCGKNPPSQRGLEHMTINQLLFVL